MAAIHTPQRLPGPGRVACVSRDLHHYHANSSKMPPGTCGCQWSHCTVGFKLRPSGSWPSATLNGAPRRVGRGVWARARTNGQEPRYRNPSTGIGTMHRVAGIGLSTSLSYPLRCRASANEHASYMPASHPAKALYHVVDDQTICFACIALGVCFSLLTLAVTGRFLLSFFPGLERAAKQARGPYTIRAFLMLDWALTPTQKGVFRMKEEGDVNYAAMAWLALMSMVLEVLFGDAGVLRQNVPDTQLLFLLNYLIFFQQMLLLPQWAMAVFRWFNLM